MRNVLKIICIGSSMFILPSCITTFCQVYETSYENMEKTDNGLYYKNKDLTVVYNFWGESGNGFFFIRNNTDKNLFVVLSQSFMIKNGCALDYFDNTEKEVTLSESTTISKNEERSRNFSIYGKTYDFTKWYYASASISENKEKGKSKSKGKSETYIEKEQPIICIPPNSFKQFGKFLISNNIVFSDNYAQDYPKHASKKMLYDKENTPMHVINRIAYSFDSNGDSPKFIKNEFWISSVVNYNNNDYKKGFTMLRKEDSNNLKFLNDFDVNSPSQFYNIYRTKGNRVNSKSELLEKRSDDIYYNAH